MFAVTGLQYFILFTAFYKKAYKAASHLSLLSQDLNQVVKVKLS